jgi:hypothetical protein
MQFKYESQLRAEAQSKIHQILSYMTGPSRCKFRLICALKLPIIQLGSIWTKTVELICSFVKKNLLPDFHIKILHGVPR